MKYAIIIPDGAADEPMEILNGRTALEAAKTPNFDWIAANGKTGTVKNIPKHLPAGSDVAILSLLGYDPRQFYTGRAPLEAAAQEIKTDPAEWIFRCNFVTLVDQVMEDYSAGHISTEEAQQLIKDLNRVLGGKHVKFHTGVSYRHLMIYDGQVDLETTPPHDIQGKKVSGYMPSGKGAETITTLIERSQDILADHEINNVRRDLGENPANSIWLWGEGKMPQLPSYESLHHLRGAAITAVDLVRGISKLIGWDVIEVEGATGYIDTNYAGKGTAAIEALGEYDVVCTHVEAPDEAGHSGNVSAKIEAIENIDRHIVGPVLNHMRSGEEDWRILVLPDHPTPCSVRTHTREEVPFALAGAGVLKVLATTFSEKAAAESDLHIPLGHELMEYFLTVRA